ncbi:MAG TPA: hypothetical protein VGX03_35665 [Candidatus Binatia bacterium]|nr:hypothetical protein [Candidatus Binatia bacterium]
MGKHDVSYLQGQGMNSSDAWGRRLLLTFWLAFPLVAWSQGGYREPIFIINDVAAAIALQADGKIVAAGGADKRFSLVRYDSDGSLDTSFGTEGKAITRISPDEDVGDIAQTLTPQADGKLVVVGTSWSGTSNDFALVRYNSDGSLDASFGKGGKVITDLSAGYDDAFALAVQADGKLVVGGMATDGIALVRYNPDGSSDSNFNSRVMITRSKVGKIVIHALALQSDGKIAVAGASEGSFALVRYNSDGSLDASFGTGGKVTTPIGDGSAVAYALTLRADGKIVVAGITFNDHDFGFAVVCYNPNGSLDTNFGTGGKVVTAIGVRSDEAHPFGKQLTHKSACRLCGVAIQADGKVVVVGSSLNRGKFDFALVRYNPDGSLDASFGTNGQITTAIGAGDDYAHAIALQKDGKIIVAGGSSDGRNSTFALIRYNPDGSLDTSFGRGGKVITRIGAGYTVW